MEDVWFDRLLNAIADSGLSYREISLKAGLSDSYVRQMIGMGKQPTISKFLKICDVIGVNPIAILTDDKSATQVNALVSHLEKMPAAKREALLLLFDIPNA